MSIKSTTCSSHEGIPLSEYPSREDAQESADFENLRRPELDFVPYKCDKCGRWHIKPKDYFIKKLSTVCSCSDSNGRPKNSYPTKEEAQKVADLREKSGVHLTVYECPHGNGWHLTSHPNQNW